MGHNMNILAITGHRSERCDESRVRKFLRKEFERTRPEYTICGMANGTDLWSAAVAIELDIGVICAKPWTTHGPRKADAELYEFVERSAAEVHVVLERDTYPGPFVYQVRNVWMVDRGDALLGIWDGTQNGGTYNCLRYAKEDTEKPFKHIHPDTGRVTYGRSIPKQSLAVAKVSSATKND